ncbi:GM15130 [Drosophila sechellia]|uniref:GM15130 n=1 Tax=Drosophila sechellia TaxID=7238 RepID=B4IND4_DROSE|nr:GM15130 [Drosophila sechellia]
MDIFPYLREPVIENATLAADTFCQHSRERSATPIYSAGRLLGLRLRFQRPPTDLASWNLTLNASYRFLKRENFRTDGRLVPHSFCDFYFFASLSSEEGNVGQGLLPLAPVSRPTIRRTSSVPTSSLVGRTPTWRSSSKNCSCRRWSVEAASWMQSLCSMQNPLT